jgi:hypothetical protein
MIGRRLATLGFWVPTIPALAALALLPRAGRGLEQAAAAPAPT